MGFSDSMQPNVRSGEARLSGAFWAMLLVTGVAAGLVGGALMRMLYWIEAHSFGYTAGGFAEGVRAASAGRKLTVLMGAGVIAAVGGWVAGKMKGDTDLDGAIWKRWGRMPVGKSTVRAVYSIVVVGMGAAVGRENALKQAGGVIANVSAAWRGLGDQERRLLVACGGGAGMAAAYNVPLGGALFALEVLLGSFSLRMALPAFGCSLLACWVSWLMLPNVATYAFVPAPVTGSLMAWAFVAGPVCGLVSGPFVRLMGWAKGGKASGWLAVGSLGALGVVSLWLPEALGNGKDVVQLTLGGVVPVGLLVGLLVVRPLATAMILRAGVPGGLFTPTMSLGAVVGLLLGRGWGVVMPMGRAELSSCALIGSAAVLAAATQGPVSALVFLLELTHTADSLMVPLLVAVVLATVVGRGLEDRSIYSIEGGVK